MACSCNCSSEGSGVAAMDWGQEGFKIRQDETFMVPADSEFAGWKTGYGPGCECGGACGCASKNEAGCSSCAGETHGTGESDNSKLFAPVTDTSTATFTTVSIGTDSHAGTGTYTGTHTDTGTSTGTSTSTSTTTNSTTATLGHCCIALKCREVDFELLKVAWPVRHCAIEKTDCKGNHVMYELLDSPPKANGTTRLGGDDSLVFAIRDPNYGRGSDTRYLEYHAVCYPCESNGADPVACDCINDKKVADYGWRKKSDYRPVRGDQGWTRIGRVAALAADGFSPNSNSFAKFFYHRCTKKDKRISLVPRWFPGWDFDFGKGAAYPPPWGGVVQADGETYRE